MSDRAMTENFSERIILALDFPHMTEMERVLSSLRGQVRYVKVGMELFYAAGPGIITELKNRGLNVFIDLKVHDIPNTAKGAVRSLASHGADMINVHAAGGVAMMEAAREGLEQGLTAGATRPLLIGVTMLTSTSQQTMNQQIGIPGTVEETVTAYAKLTAQAGLDGVVASPLEVPLIKEAVSPSFITVTPGIRPKGTDQGDQTRITTPEDALIRLGSDYIVIGRAITAAADPSAAWENMMEQLKRGETTA
ncbi:orotidine-5'-phosphate decarboxylase [Brevibacillus dissolubilis]|uniref:orotidine-5'-phosphate decarboxylase n=1 Tax=Brevibacillus dissolubilis TaxID=1844116 RepID=UPI001117892B|nr:orotidine-5'-phosphate decarboxylase [Brevibacillus dissolubilis]